MTYTRVPADLLVRYACEADQIYVRYEKLSTRETRRGGFFVRGDPQRRYIRLRSAWQHDPKRTGAKVIFSVQIDDDKAFLIDKHAADMLQARSRYPITITPPPSPFTAAGYDSDLSDIGVDPHTSRACRHGSPNIDRDELYYHDGRADKKRRVVGPNHETIYITDGEVEPIVHR